MRKKEEGVTRAGGRGRVSIMRERGCELGEEIERVMIREIQ